MYYTRFDTRFCEIILAGDEIGLSHLHLNTGEGKRSFEISDEWTRNDDYFSDTRHQIEEYLSGTRKNFDVRLNPKGTDFQKKVWTQLRTVPYGEVRTYKDIAEAIGNADASRAVGMANSKNPIPLIIPCHRIIGTNGKLTGFAHGLAIKERIINHEKLMTLLNQLLSYYGKQGWWPAETHYEMMVGAVLAQNTTWKNVVKALDNFNGDLSPRLIKEISTTALAEIIRPSGYFNQKAIKLKALNDWYERYDFNIDKVRSVEDEKLRQELLTVHGVGRETADSIMTYAVGKPYFIIDTYTRRLFHRLGFDVPAHYEDFRNMIEKAIPRDLYLYNEFHALIVRHATEHCLKTPKCEGCPLETPKDIQGDGPSEVFCVKRI